jgi:multidrug efflux pump subunit AcrA (membrane-fusion protein)
MTDEPTRKRRGVSSLTLVESPSALRQLSRLLLGLAAIVVFALIFTPWQQNVQGAGRVVAREPYDRIQTMAAPVDGRVRRTWVVEGSRVAEGDPVIEIVDNDPAILDRLSTQLGALQAQLDAARAKATIYRDQIEVLGSAREMATKSAQSQVEVAAAAEQSARHGLDAARAAATQAKLNYERQRELFAEGLASELEYEIAERSHLEAKARAQQAQEAWNAARNDREAKEAQLGQVDTEARAGIETAKAFQQSVQVEISALVEKIASFESRIAQQSTQLLTAPRDGTILRVFAAPGAELVKAGDPLVQFIPDTESRVVELWVDGNHVPLVQEGRSVRLQFEGWPAVQFAGWPSVAVGTFGGRVLIVDRSADATGRFRMLVAPDPDDQPWPTAELLRQGARATGFVLLDRVSLGYELWRQANDFPPTVAMGPPMQEEGKS